VNSRNLSAEGVSIAAFCAYGSNSAQRQGFASSMLEVLPGSTQADSIFV